MLFLDSTNNMLLSKLILYGCSCGQQMKDIMLRDDAMTHCSTMMNADSAVSWHFLSGIGTAT